MTQNPHPPRMMDTLCRTIACAMLFLAVFCLLQACYPAFAEETGQAIAILKQPENAIVQEGDIATFTVETGDDLYFYEWQRRANENALWESLPVAGYQGVNTDELMVCAAHPYVDGGYQYRCLISDDSGHFTGTVPVSLIVWSFDENAKVLSFSGCGSLSGWEDYNNRPWKKEILEATSIVVQEGITEIGENALYGAGDGYGVESATIYIPCSVISIGTHALTSGNLERIVVDKDNQFFSDVDGVLFDKERETLICKPGRGGGIYKIPDGTKAIADYAFEWCAYYQEFIIPEGVEEIGDFAFSSCHGLKQLIFPDGIREIGYGTFPNVVRIPASVERIGSDFLTNAEMYPGSTEVYYCGTKDQWNEINFYNRNSDSEGYIVYFLHDENDLWLTDNQVLSYESIFDYAGRWMSGEYYDKSMHYANEMDIRFAGDNNIVFTWRESRPTGSLQLSDCMATMDPESGLVHFEGQRYYATEANGWLRFSNGSVTLHIDHSDLNGLEDGYEFVFDTKDGDRLQSALWFRQTPHEVKGIQMN